MRGPVLFIRSGALGDFVLTLPVLYALLDAGLVVDVAVPERFRCLLPQGIRQVWSMDRREGLWIFDGSRQDHQSVVCFSPALAEMFVGLEVYAVPPFPTTCAARYYASVIPSLTVDVYAPLRVDVPAMTHLRGCVVFSPGSGGLQKRWPLTHWRALEAQLNRSVLWVGGPLETEEGWVQYQPNLLETVALAREASVWLGPDSGPCHLAAAAGARTGVIFVSTDPAIWAPLRTHIFSADVDIASLAQWVEASNRLVG